MVSLFQAVLAFFAPAVPAEPPPKREGKIADIIDIIEPGRIWCVWHGATYWSARSHRQANFRLGERVRVVERQGLVLFIEPLETEEQ